MYFDYYYVILVLPAVLLSLWAQIKVSLTFNRYSKIQSQRGMSGEQAAETLLRLNHIGNVSIEGVGGKLTDHYDPSSKVLRLSEPVYRRTSIAAIGVAAHETGHAIQDAQKYGPLVLRSALVPAANIGSQAGPILVIIGIFASISLLTKVGIILFAAAVLFYFVTLPVEIDASRRALAILRSSGALNQDELKGVRKVLTAAALTYVASAILALANLVRLVLIARGRQRRRSSW
ncbi:MAG: zinc metallopeptidase [Spirochaetaceae bacterium]|jgi:Zn-dependent membrane protease YugP|nr:zinc metallopeptidase [Spirochaetaceae bacterium]